MGFSKPCFSGWRSEGGQDPQGKKAPKCFKLLVFSSILWPSEGGFLQRHTEGGTTKEV